MWEVVFISEVNYWRSPPLITMNTAFYNRVQMMFSVLCLVEQTIGGGHKQSNLMQNYSELLQEHNCDSCVVLISKYLCDSSHFPFPFSFPAPLHLMPTIHNALSNLSPFFLSLSLLPLCWHSPGCHMPPWEKKFKHLFLTFFSYKKKKSPPLTNLYICLFFVSPPWQRNSETFWMSHAGMASDRSSGACCFSVYHPFFSPAEFSFLHFNSPFFPYVLGLCLCHWCTRLFPPYSPSLRYLCHYIPLPMSPGG